jgi:hypothetical protein
MQRLRSGFAALALAIAPLVATPAFAADAPNGKPKSALAPVAPAVDPDAPPEGKGPGGLDFGRWRSEAPQRTSGAFAAEVARLSAQGEVRAALERDGFGCFDPHRPGITLICTRSAIEGSCGYDWQVEIRAGAPSPAARFEAHCLSPRKPK